jgi:hypothetical protein
VSGARVGLFGGGAPRARRYQPRPASASAAGRPSSPGGTGGAVPVEKEAAPHPPGRPVTGEQPPCRPRKLVAVYDPKQPCGCKGGGLGRSRPSVSRHISNYDLLSCWVPEIVNPKAAFGVSRVTAVLDVPIRRMSFPLPLEIKLILAAMIVIYPILDRFVSKAAASADSPGAAVVRQP